MKKDNKKELPLFLGNIFIKGLIKNNNGVVIKKETHQDKDNKGKKDDEDDNIYKFFKRPFIFIIRYVINNWITDNPKLL